MKGGSGLGVVVMAITWVWTDGVQLMMNNYASFFLLLLILLFFFPSSCGENGDLALISCRLEKQETTLMNGDETVVTKIRARREKRSPQAGSRAVCRSPRQVCLIRHSWGELVSFKRRGREAAVDKYSGKQEVMAT